MNCIAGLSALMLMLIAGPSLASGSKTAADAELAAAAKKNGALLISYAAPLRQVMLTRDLHLVDIEQRAEYDNPVAAEPSATKTVKKVGKVSEGNVTELLRNIEETGFFALKPSYGGSAQERNYPYEITVWQHDKEMRVVYHSRPDAEPRPAAFAKTEQKILEFAQRNAAELNTGGK